METGFRDAKVYRSPHGVGGAWGHRLVMSPLPPEYTEINPSDVSYNWMVINANAEIFISSGIFVDRHLDSMEKHHTAYIRSGYYFRLNILTLSKYNYKRRNHILRLSKHISIF